MFGRKSTVHQGEYDLQERKAWEVMEGEGISKKLICAIVLITLLIIAALVFAILLFIALKNQPEATSEDLLPSPRAFTDTPEPPPSDPDNTKTFVGSFVDKGSNWTEEYRNVKDPKTKTKMREYEEMMFDSFYTEFAHNSIPQVKMLSPAYDKKAILMQNKAVEPFVKVRFEISMAPTVEITEAKLMEWLQDKMGFADIHIELGGRNQIVQLFQASMNRSAKPCEDFFSFACGNYKKQETSFTAIQYGAADAVAEEIHRTNSLARTVSQAKIAFKTCTQLSPETDYTAMLLADIRKIFGKWPGKQSELDTKKLFEKMGQLVGLHGVNTLLRVSVDVDWKRQPSTPYVVYIDQATLTLPAVAYGKNISRFYLSALHKVMYKTFKYLAKAQISPESLNDTVNKMIELEVNLAKMSTPSQDRRNYTALYNPMKIEDVKRKYGSINFENFLRKAMEEHHMTPELVDNRLIFKDESYFKQLNTFLNGQTSEQKATLVNYLVWRYFHAYGFLVPIPVLKGIFEEFKAQINGKKEEITMETVCALQIMQYLPFVAGRLYIDTHWKNLDPTARDEIRKMITQVLGAFGEELDSLNWMSAQTKWQARLKIKNLIDNVAYPDWILNDSELDATDPDQQLRIPSDNFYNVLKALQRFQGYRLFHYLNKTKVDRSDFGMSPAMVNAWYNPTLNSITFPAAILNSPFFRTDFPMAVNFGGLGVVLGHELTHGYDDGGVQFGPTGKLTNWMDKQSATGFRKMADCVVEQYDNFRDPTVHLNISGKNTQGENIADNGGIRSSYRAYQNWVKEMGPEHHLPAPMNKYSMDQIFFLSFAQVWCSHMGPDELRMQILVDVHSPPKYRILGTLQNFEKFGEAFGCQVGSNMAPKDHCFVWGNDTFSAV